MIADSMPAEALARRAAAYGLDVTKPRRAVVFVGDQAAALAGRMPEAFVAGRLGNTVALVAPDVQVPTIGLAGIGPTATGIVGIIQSVLEATRIAEVAVMLKRAGIVSRDDLGVYSLLLDPKRAGELLAQARSLLAPLLAYDAAHGQGLVRTLEAFLDAQGRPAEAARRLRIHVNSIYYRLSRVKELSGFALDEPEVRLQLHLACRIIRLAKSKLL
jgi:DNA-binding PucR family transcriptional regulator